MITVGIGQHVKCFLRNGMVLEGIVEKNTTAEVALKALDGQSLMILHRPTEDIMMTKVVLVESASEQEVEKQSASPPSEFQEKVVSKLNEIKETENDLELKEKSIAELKQMVLEQERRILTQKRREHFGTVGAAKLTSYSSPYMPKRLSNASGAQMVPHKPCKNNAD